MKRIILLCLMCMVALGAMAQAQKGTTEYLSEKRGFKVFKMNTPIHQYIKYLTPDGDGKVKGEKHYSVSDSTLLRVGNIKLQWIQVVAFNDTIQKVGICVDSKYNKDFFNVITESFGKGRQSNKYIEKYYWYSPNVTLSYDAQFKGKNGLVLFIDDEVTLRKTRFEQQQAKQNSEDL